MAFTVYSQEKLNKHEFGITAYTQPTDWFVALHTASPGTSGSANEVTAGGYSYARQEMTPQWDNTNKWIENAAALQWDNLPAVTITHISIWDAVSSGNCLRYGALSASKTIAAGDSFKISAENLTDLLSTSL